MLHMFHNILRTETHSDVGLAEIVVSVPAFLCRCPCPWYPSLVLLSFWGPFVFLGLAPFAFVNLSLIDVLLLPPSPTHTHPSVLDRSDLPEILDDSSHDQSCSEPQESV